MKALLLFLMGSISGMALADDGNIDSANKSAWSENAGWINARPTHGGILVYDGYLAGYAWAENIGWIKLGSEGGGPYDNSNSVNWGVNRDGNTLNGFAWSENVGWINFSPSQGQVSLDPETGAFDGYAWAENIGWIHVQNSVPAYQVQAIFPTAVVTGEADICEGMSTDLEVELTGFGPWDLEWSDGFIQNQVTESLALRTVTPLETTDYSLVQIKDSFAGGTPTGAPRVTVHAFSVRTNPDVTLARGWNPEVLEAFEDCGFGTVEYQWSILTGTGAPYFFDLNENPIVLDDDPHPIPMETSEYQIEVTDSSLRTMVSKTVRILVAVDPVYFDVVPDECNNLKDLWALCQEWRKAYAGNNDPDGDGLFTVQDYLYINLSDPIDCAPPPKRKTKKPGGR